MTLQTSDFAAFHAAVHGHPPFPWQQRLLERVVTRRSWPAVLDLPTGAGKTSCIDIALFALALDAATPPADRWCPRRIAMVVDRRVVVDQAAERGRRLLAALTRADDVPVLAAVRDALASLTGGDEEPLAVYTLRGGIPKDDGWARTPHQPLVIASTVDQVGSRLLIQGYGVSPGMRPVHAGLLANDTLLLLDEVHLSRPFAQTLDALQRLRSRARPESVPSLPQRFHRVFLSATPGGEVDDSFRLDAAERAPESALGPRLHAAKPVTTSTVKTRDALPAACAELALRLLDRHAVVAVVVNRVASARQTAALLRERGASDVDVVLLTGRMRPLDRDDLLARWWPRIASGRTRDAADGRLIVVATQCIEAGADLDFDAMVSESASLDALRQRLGRVDRLGRYGRAEAVVVHVSGEARDDPIYGAALKSTWDWLKGQKKLDFGIERLALPEEPGPLLAPLRRAPTLLPAYVDLWMQTAPAPALVPDVALFLHGPQSGPADVQVLWRADLDEAMLAGDDPAAARSVVAAVRPSSLETVSLPFVAARAWLRGDGAADIADVDAVAGADDDTDSTDGGRRALCWRGDDSRIIGADELRPGDTLVVPSTRGGLSSGSFDPAGTEPVSDLAERAALMGRGCAVLRLHPAVLAGLGLTVPDDEDPRPSLRRAAEGEDGWRSVWLQALAARLRTSVVAPGGGREAWRLLEAPRLAPAELRRRLGGEPLRSVEGGADLCSDDEDSFHAGRAGITLARHSADVEGFARRYAEALGLPSALASDIALAAWLHDIGKADQRFQLLLRGGDEIEFFKDERAWAKSRISPADRDAARRAQQRSGYPAGARHELQSLALIEAARERVAALAHDLDLVLHLVASHHGHCRPFAPVAADPAPVDVALAGHESPVFGRLDFPTTTSDHRLWRLDSPLAERFWRLVERYGWQELCWLEAVLRLADHRASEAEERGQEP
ncbi:type I-G CRISPR-associated helicase/endonuclease Cas3g [Rubrivivax gelatinosus]|uniref:CRISPR-associated endonuclease/helicase Cas3 n=1 Tax=Rubrivivax gelatinosus TaxID=28068 RepID=A0A4R2MXN5_RUBGE|nr:type I-U CRISPR-associated helicase/endonuclease Cas3 [Rubrivivax gelatinosus]MBK1686663.1 hypothetical protein [Rubrivivax gelatinosus]TCP05313.1 CRISPR-associated endonuclease/helicase Cas3 [Rubrivivax gelatinosus]